MLRKELTRRVAAEAKLSQVLVDQVIDAIRAVAYQAVAGGHDVMLMGLGVLRVSPRAARSARHMVTGEPVTVPAHNVVVLRASNGLNRSANPQK